MTQAPRIRARRSTADGDVDALTVMLSGVQEINSGDFTAATTDFQNANSAMNQATIAFNQPTADLGS